MNLQKSFNNSQFFSSSPKSQSSIPSHLLYQSKHCISLHLNFPLRSHIVSRGLPIDPLKSRQCAQLQNSLIKPQELIAQHGAGPKGSQGFCITVETPPTASTKRVWYPQVPFEFQSTLTERSGKKG